MNWKVSQQTNLRKKVGKYVKKTLRATWDIEKRSNIHVIEVIEGKERENKSETIFNEKLTETFPRQMRDIKLMK